MTAVCTQPSSLPLQSREGPHGEPRTGRRSVRGALLLGTLALACALSACSKQLLGSLDEMSANQLVSTLRVEGVAAEKSAAGEKAWKVSVPDDQFAEAVQIMERHNLPAQQFQGLGQVFKKESLVSTPTEERARLIHAVSQELEHSLLEIDGVLVARVHPVILPHDPLNPKRSTATASVLIKYRAGMDITGRESMVRSLVAAGVEGLSYDDVRVVMVPAEARAPATRPAAAARAGANSWFSQIPPLFLGGMAALLALLLLTFAWMKWRSPNRGTGEVRGRWADTMGGLVSQRDASPSKIRNQQQRPKSVS
jgi:type III secretion protein J